MPTKHTLLFILILSLSAAFSQESLMPEEAADIEQEALEPAPAAEPEPPAPAVEAPPSVPSPPPLIPAAALPKPVVSVSQMLSGSSLSRSCVGDFTELLEKDSFDMAKFVKELPPAVAKVKLQLKSPFGKPKDSERTNVGLTVGCIKALPESPAEIQSLLKDISLKMGLDFAADAAISVADISIPANAGGGGSGGSVGKSVVSVGLVAAGLGAIGYGIKQNNDVSHSVDKRNGEKAVRAERNRNIGYAVGAAMLASGVTVYIAF
ncbi:MAG: hypothetical protein LBC85_09205 [Fibromonadaceae bacterium]|nr:hypothetical protein [Fibromonadaceae bacterium]